MAGYTKKTCYANADLHNIYINNSTLNTCRAAYIKGESGRPKKIKAIYVKQDSEPIKIFGNNGISYAYAYVGTTSTVIDQGGTEEYRPAIFPIGKYELKEIWGDSLFTYVDNISSGNRTLYAYSTEATHITHSFTITEGGTQAAHYLPLYGYALNPFTQDYLVPSLSYNLTYWTRQATYWYFQLDSSSNSSHEVRLYYYDLFYPGPWLGQTNKIITRTSATGCDWLYETGVYRIVREGGSDTTPTYLQFKDPTFGWSEKFQMEQLGNNYQSIIFPTVMNGESSYTTYYTHFSYSSSSNPIIIKFGDGYATRDYTINLHYKARVSDCTISVGYVNDGSIIDYWDEYHMWFSTIQNSINWLWLNLDVSETYTETTINTVVSEQQDPWEPYAFIVRVEGDAAIVPDLTEINSVYVNTKYGGTAGNKLYDTGKQKITLIYTEAYAHWHSFYFNGNSPIDIYVEINE